MAALVRQGGRIKNAGSGGGARKCAAEIESLESGSGAVSERARMRLGMIRSDEILFRLVPKGKTAAPVPEIPEKPTGKQQIFSPKRSDLYVPGSIEDGQEAQQKSRTP